MVIIILIIVFGGIAGIAYIDNAGKTARRAMSLSTQDAAQPLSDAAHPALPRAQSDGPESLALRLPEPARTQAWKLLCMVIDARKNDVDGDTRTAYLLSQTREAYLPDTLRAYLSLTDGARRTLESQGQPPETLLTEQLGLLEDGVREALRHDHATADRLLSQGRFLRERFGAAESELSLKPGVRKS